MNPTVARLVFECGTSAPLASKCAWGIIDALNAAAVSHAFRRAFAPLVRTYPVRQRMREFFEYHESREYDTFERLLRAPTDANICAVGGVVLQAVVYADRFADEQCADVDIAYFGIDGTRLWAHLHDNAADAPHWSPLDSLSPEHYHRRRLYLLNAGKVFPGELMAEHMRECLPTLDDAHDGRARDNFAPASTRTFAMRGATSRCTRLGAKLTVTTIAIDRARYSRHARLLDALANKYDLSACAVTLGFNASGLWRLAMAHPDDARRRHADINAENACDATLGSRIARYRARHFTLSYDGIEFDGDNRRVVDALLSRRRKRARTSDSM